MPGGIGHTFVKKRFIDPYKQKRIKDLYDASNIVIEGRGGNKRIYIHSTLKDNKEHIDPSYEQSLKGRPEAERKAKLDGDWDAYLGQVFDEFRDRHYPDEPDNALHVVKPFDIPAWWPRFVIGDWGYAAMTYIGFYAVSPTKRLYLYRELYWLKTLIENWAPVIRNFVEFDNPKVVKFCKSAGQERGQEHTIQEQISTALGRPIELSNNSPGSRVAGKMLVHEYLRWQPKPVIPPDEMPIYNEEYASWLLRNKGLIDYKSYLSIFEPIEPETNIPKLQIFLCESDEHSGHPNCCPTMIDSIKACSYDKKGKDGKAAEDVAEFEGDDPYDDLRYAVDTADNYFKDAQYEFAKVQKQEQILRALEMNKDWTAFYRNSAALEAKSKEMQVVKRYHRGR